MGFFDRQSNKAPTAHRGARRVAAERHRQSEVGVQTGDARAALATVNWNAKNYRRNWGVSLSSSPDEAVSLRCNNQIQIEAICAASEAFSIPFRARLSEKLQSRLGR
jgi:hypothetical protein